MLGGIQQRAGVDGAVAHDVHGRENVDSVQAPQVQIVDVGNAFNLPQRGLDDAGVEARRNLLEQHAC